MKNRSNQTYFAVITGFVSHRYRDKQFSAVHIKDKGQTADRSDIITNTACTKLFNITPPSSNVFADSVDLMTDATEYSNQRAHS